MPDSIVNETLREIEPLGADELIGPAARRVIDAGPARRCPRSRRTAASPASSASASSWRRSSPATSASSPRRRWSRARSTRRSSGAATARCEPIRRYLTTDHVLVEDDYSDTQLAEIFLHHRVLIVPIATKGKVHAVITRHDFFSLAGRALRRDRRGRIAVAVSSRTGR